MSRLNYVFYIVLIAFCIYIAAQAARPKLSAEEEHINHMCKYHPEKLTIMDRLACKD